MLKNFELMLNGNDFNSTILQDATSFEGVKQFPMRIKCALLPWMGLKDILFNQQKSENNSNAHSTQIKQNKYKNSK
jgi:nitrogen fixation NifU-like protein